MTEELSTAKALEQAEAKPDSVRAVKSCGPARGVLSLTAIAPNAKIITLKNTETSIREAIANENKT